LIPQEKVWQLPFTIDLVRLATSIILAAEAVKIEAPMDKVTEFLIAGYEDGLKAGEDRFFLKKRIATSCWRLCAL
jgi:hypothetical protein